MLVSIGALATPGAGFVFNLILAQGRTAGAVNQAITVHQGPCEGPCEDWDLSLNTHGPSDFYIQDVALAPGGYSGWHNHPGLLLVTVTEGANDWYDQDCVLRHYTTGQSFTENNKPHNIFNRGSVNVRLLVAYIIKASAPRRIENDQPPCGAELGLP
jgi:hypothetical protein